MYRNVYGWRLAGALTLALQRWAAPVIRPPLYGRYPNWISATLGREVLPQKRRSVDEILAAREFWDLDHLNRSLPDLRVLKTDVLISERGGRRLSAEVAVPHGGGPHPVILYLHGGSWSLWSPSHLRRQVALLAAQGFVTVNLDYGLAPEHPFPWATIDTIETLAWIVQRIGDYGGDPHHIVVGGDSAGANLVAGALTALLPGADGSPFLEGVELPDADDVAKRVAGALFLYGVYDFPLLISNPLGNRHTGVVETTWNIAYLGIDFLSKHLDPLVSPVYASNLAGFPPTYLTVGDRDQIYPQSLRFAEALIVADVPTRLSVVPEADHEFLLLDETLPIARAELDDIARWLAGLIERRAARGIG